MSTLFGRHYARPLAAVGATEKAAGIIILLLLAGIVTAFVVDAARPHAPLFEAPAATDPPASRAVAESAQAFSGLELPDWQPPATVEHFTRDDLHVKIDGRAELFLPLGVVALDFGTYARRDDPTRGVDVYWYDMGTADGARRIFDVEKPTDTEAIAIGEVAYSSGGAVFFRKGANYVQVLPAQPEDAQVTRLIAKRLAAGM